MHRRGRVRDVLRPSRGHRTSLQQDQRQGRARLLLHRPHREGKVGHPSARVQLLRRVQRGNWVRPLNHIKISTEAILGKGLCRDMTKKQF